MSQDNIDLIEELLVGDGLECDFARKGTYSLAGTERELEELILFDPVSFSMENPNPKI